MCAQEEVSNLRKQIEEQKGRERASLMVPYEMMKNQKVLRFLRGALHPDVVDEKWRERAIQLSQQLP